MNIVFPKSGKIHPEDDIRPVLVSAQDRQAYYEDLKREKIRERRWKRIGRFGSVSLVVILATTATVEAIAIIALLPLKEVVPMITYVRDDGTTVHTAQWDSLPKHVKEETTVNVVWQYVQHRESWSIGNAPLAYDVVSAISSPKVREQWQDYYDPENPLSPQNVYGETTVQAKYVNWMPVCPEPGCSGAPTAYRFWFDRIETVPGQQPGKPVRYAVTVRILRNVPLPADRIAWRWTFNAPLIQVIDYPGAQREGIAR